MTWIFFPTDRGNHVSQEGNELGAGVAQGRFAHDLPAGNLPGGETADTLFFRMNIEAGDPYQSDNLILCDQPDPVGFPMRQRYSDSSEVAPATRCPHWPHW